PVRLRKLVGTFVTCGLRAPGGGLTAVMWNGLYSPSPFPTWEAVWALRYRRSSETAARANAVSAATGTRSTPASTRRRAHGRRAPGSRGAAGGPAYRTREPASLGSLRLYPTPRWVWITSGPCAASLRRR